MLVYGDRLRTRAPRAMLSDLERNLRRAQGRPADERDDLLTGALIAAGELAQGLADAEFEARGVDEPSAIQTAAMALAVAIARQLFGTGNGAPSELAALAALQLPPTVRCKTPEGYAFYAVYPQSYFVAARAYQWSIPPLVLGLRSIGTSLAAAVVAATGGRALSLRPCGHPFARQIRGSEALKSLIRAHAGPFAVVDEGPGLSGSSFGAAADLLDGLGVARDRVVFLPSHGGDPGAQATPAWRARWTLAPRRVVTLDDLLARDPIGRWFADLIGPAVRVEDLSAGAWRRDLSVGDWPPVIAFQERRKFRLHTASGAYLARFAGLGAIGKAKLARAQALAAAGFTPEPIVLRRGFLLERWEAGARPDTRRVGRAAFLAHVARYLGFRARHFAAGPEDGASLGELRDMAVQNTFELIGRCDADAVARRLQALPGRAGALRRVHVDARLHPWEWLRRPDGRICKTDALDHSEAHDLVGCQDVAWDVAGAAVEFGLSRSETRDFAAAVGEASGHEVSPAAVAAFRTCYAALQAGACTLETGHGDGAERERIRRRLALYAAQLSPAAVNH
jgi:hypothetical protein